MSDTTSIVIRRLEEDEDMLRLISREIVGFGRNRNKAAAVSCIALCYELVWGVYMYIIVSALTCHYKLLFMDLSRK